MSLVSKILAQRRGGAPVAYALPIGIGGLTGARNTQAYLEAYGNVGWLFACVSRIAFSVGQSQWMLCKADRNGELVEVSSHPLLSLWRKPNPFMTAVELLEYSQMYLDLSGEAWWILNRTEVGRVAEIWPVAPQYMRVMPDKDKFISGYVYQRGAEKVPFALNEVVQFKYPNPNDLYRGLGPVQAIAIDIDTETYAATWNRNFFLNSARPDGVLEVPETLTDTEFERIQQQWRSEHQGVERAHRIAILEGGTKYAKVGLSQQDMSWIEQRKLTRNAILGAFGMPLPILGITEDVNRANSETAEYIYARWVLLPRLERIKTKLNTVLAPMFDPNLQFDFEDPTPENVESNRMLAEAGAQTGALMVDEIRELLGQDALEGGRGRMFLWPMMQTPVPVGSLAGGKGLPQAIIKQFSSEQKDAAISLFDKRNNARRKKMKAFMDKHFAGQSKRVVAEIEGHKAAKQAGGLMGADFWDKELESLLNQAEPYIHAFLEEAAREMIDDYGLGISFDINNPRVFAWIGQRLRLFSTAVTEETKDAIIQSLRIAYDQGESIADMVKRIKQYYDNIGYRAERVARTEVISASNRGGLESYIQAGVPFKQWWTHIDGREREWHNEAHGQIQAMLSPFVVMGEAVMCPGDGSAANAINCRCGLIPLNEREG